MNNGETYSRRDRRAGRLLAIDFGLKRIGLALCDPLFTFAYPFKTISNDKNTLKELNDIITTQQVNKIIMGLPVKENGAPGSISEDVFKLKSRLENRFKIEVILRDESYTSFIAKDIIQKTVTKKSRRQNKELVDQSAAAIILQDYMDEMKKKGNNS